MKLTPSSLYTVFLFSLGAALIIPNELPTILSLIYSNIPPLKIGQDTRFGIGFRLGPHADFQTLVEVGPQINTGQLGPQEGQAKRDITPKTTPKANLVLPQEEAKKVVPQVEEKKPKKTPPKKTISPFMEKIVFKKVPGIDDR